MANQRHLAVVKQGTVVWNEWRIRNPEIVPDLSHADLSCMSMPEINLQGTHLQGANFNNSTLLHADLSHAELSQAFFVDTNLTHANLAYANIAGAYLTGASLRHAILDFAQLQISYLHRTLFHHTRCVQTDFSHATFGWAQFDTVNLCETRGLEFTIHQGPSEISLSTLSLMLDCLPVTFLRLAGVSEALIQKLQAKNDPFIFPSRCFVWYADKDSLFAQNLHHDLSQQYIPCWLVCSNSNENDIFEFDLDVNDDLDDLQIEVDKNVTFSHIAENYKPLFDHIVVVLSEESIQLEEIGFVYEFALEQEKKYGKPILLPVLLDEAVKQSPLLTEMLAQSPSRPIFDFTQPQHLPYAAHHALSQLIQKLQSS